MVFSDGGYHASTMQQIAEEVGVAVGALYKVFASKDALYSALVQDFAESLGDCLETSLETGDDAVGRIMSFVYAKGEYLHQHESMARFYGDQISRLAAPRSADAVVAVTRYRDRVHRALAGVFREGMATGVFREDDADRLTVVLQSVTTAFVSLWLLDPTRYPYKETVTPAVAVLFRGMLVDSSRHAWPVTP